MKKAFLLCLALPLLFVSDVSEPSPVSAEVAPPEHHHLIWYVRRSTRLLVASYSSYETYGPFSTRAEAVAKQVELDANRVSRTHELGFAEVYGISSRYSLPTRKSPWIRK